MEMAIYNAPTIHCEGCASSIKRSLGKLPGVRRVEVDIGARCVRVQYDAAQVDDAAIRARLAMAGFPVAGSEV
ncbi:MAG TPA: heavy-metal-associated domain-containing protein [Chthonomonadales bacterium]|nr:heavy-metal-associated domain-containing protein [Chthonomonadales bacterium]